MKQKPSLLSAAHALHAATSLAGIISIPPAILYACPAGPIAKPFLCIIHFSGTYLPLVWSLGSVALWLLILSRIYNFAGIWKFLRHGHLKDHQPPPLPDTEQARLTASCLRLK